MVLVSLVPSRLNPARTRGQCNVTRALARYAQWSPFPFPFPFPSQSRTYYTAPIWRCNAKRAPARCVVSVLFPFPFPLQSRTYWMAVQCHMGCSKVCGIAFHFLFNPACTCQLAPTLQVSAVWAGARYLLLITLSPRSIEICTHYLAPKLYIVLFGLWDGFLYRFPCVFPFPYPFRACVQSMVTTS